ncbi:type I secretion membrane fusion protein, HlyD family [Bradyrhizobium sp. NFR13]|uniref:HlyD family type I secretion periplasmic adaptor subunit n=1 Tax=Bradyrhizobium sp. NFR13 TaxID=1566285 RepID=UPI0008E96F78|nr:HlyD family type I secretion periplasmic adaptor subunit [Bradyrhizobium sp. NFR13]SFL36938.1 type I secretion membrane fusion protein, HlyD family [Bradyrhizobium sp. NFR13]
MNIPKLRAETAAHDELARLLTRLSDGGRALRSPDVLQRFAEVKTRLLAWLSKAKLAIFPNNNPGNDNGTPTGDWHTPARRGFGIVFLTFVVFGGWAGLASIDGAVVAAGSVVVESDRKSVQHLEGGIVQSLMVRGDSHVEQGQVLLRLEPTQERAREEMARSAVYSAIAEEGRLLAEAEGADTITFSSELMQKASDPSAQRAMGDQKRRFEERRAARKIEVSILEEKIGQAQRQIQGNAAQSKAARAQFDSMAQEYTKLKPLADQGIVPFARIATLERSKSDLEGRIGSYDADIARFGRIIDEARLQINQVGQKVLEEATGKLADTRAQLADAREKLRMAADVLGRTEVRAPRSGRIVNLKVHTVGAVIKAGDVLMEIVPDNDVLVVAAKIPSLDVNHVQVGMPTEVRLPSFKARSTPIAVGEVLSVGADALRDEVTHQPYYEVKVSVQVTKFPEKVREKLKPGMMADVLIATGERTVLAYLVQPMTDAIRRGMRED